MIILTQQQYSRLQDKNIIQKQQMLKTIKQDSKPLSGRWSKSQHERFLKGYQKYGRNWIQVKKIVKTRTLSQIRSHAQKMFLNRNSILDSFISDNSEAISYQDISKEQSKLQIQHHPIPSNPQKFSQSPSNTSGFLNTSKEQQSKQKSTITSISPTNIQNPKISLPITNQFQQTFQQLPNYFLMYLYPNHNYLINGWTYIDYPLIQ